MNVVVTARHIRVGKIGRSRGCPIALALREILPAPWDLVVGTRYVGLEGRDTPVRNVPLPREARVFIAAFDRGDPVSPFSFDLELDPITPGA